MTKEKVFLINLVNDEGMINHNNLFFKTGNFVIDNYNFLKKFGTLHDVFFDLITEAISIKKAVEEINEMIKT